MRAAARAEAAATGQRGHRCRRQRRRRRGPQPATNTPVVKSDWDKTPRNAPCPCGSGKKYKLCHGKA